ncbi:MAG: coiled-coil domain-containing protein [Planctomycetota bacterium]
MPEPKEHAKRRNWVETVLRYIPGFRGYLEKEYRRESDELQRQWLADRLQRSKRAIDELARPLADAGKIDALPQIDRLRGRLDKLIGRIRGAMQGYSGFFDLVRIREDLLDRVYEHDVALMEQVDALARRIEELPDQPDQIASGVPELLDQIDTLEQKWDVREDMLDGLE